MMNRFLWCLLLFAVTKVNGQFIEQAQQLNIVDRDIFPAGNETRTYIAQEGIQIKPNSRIGVTAGSLVKFVVNPYWTLPEEREKPYGPVARVLDTSKPVGTMPSSWTVSDNGAFNYTIPISLPPGTNEMNPSLTISYNSQIERSNLGIGWNVNLPSSISLIGKDIFHDNVSEAVRFDNTDNLSLDGNRLYLVSGANLSDGSVYRCYSENFSKITAYKGTGSFVDYFVVETKKGLEMEYGRRNNSRQDFINKSGTLKGRGKWFLNRVTDRFGNYIDYEYEEFGKAEILVSRISYTGTKSFQPYNYIQFSYKSRKNPKNYFKRDVFSTEFDDCREDDTQIIKDIQIWSEGTLVTKYDFGYTSAQSPTEKLLSITLSDKNGISYNPHVVEWDESTSNLASPFAITTSEFTPNNFHIKFNKEATYGDFNGDGRTDIVKSGKKIIGLTNCEITYNSITCDTLFQDYIGIWIANPNGEMILRKTVVSPVGGRFYQHKGKKVGNLISDPSARTFDFNNNGIEEMVLTTQNQSDYTNSYHLYEYNEATNSINPVLPSLNIGSSGLSEIEILDLDNDGNNEIYWIEDHRTIKVYYPNSNSFESKIIQDQSGRTFTGLRSIDTDHNGLPELYIGTYISTNTVYWGNIRFEKNSSGLSFNLFAQANVDMTRPWLDNVYVDFNGDGLSDLFKYGNMNVRIAGREVIESGGVYSYTPYNSNGQPNGNIYKYSYYPNDFDLDGRADMLVVEKVSEYNFDFKLHITKALPSELKSWYTTYTCNIGRKIDLGTICVRDFNGDGRPDIRCIDEHGTLIKIDFLEGLKANVISKIADGLNKTVHPTFTYGTQKLGNVTDFFINSKINSAYPPLTLVDRVYEQTGEGIGYMVNSYGYQNPRTHFRGLGFLGFTSFNSTQEYYDLNDVLYKQVKGATNVNFDPITFNVSSRDFGQQINGTLTSLSNTEFGKDLIDGTRMFVYPAKIVSGSPVQELFRIEENDYDNNGNLTKKTIKSGTNEVISVTENLNFIAKGSWIESKPQKSRVTKFKPGESEGFVIDEDFTYTSNGEIESIIGFSNKLEQSKQNFTYDDFGNLESSTVGGTGVQDRTTTYEYLDPKKRLPSSVKNALGQVTSKMEYDFRWGLVKKVTDINGHEVQMEFDNFGAPTKSISPNGVETTTRTLWSKQDLKSSLFKVITETPGASTAEVYSDAFGVKRMAISTSFGGKKIKTESKYNPDLSILSTDLPSFENDQSAGKVEFSYDNISRPQTVKYPTGKINSFSYSGKVETSSSQNESKTTTLNSSGQVVSSLSNTGLVDYTYYNHGGIKSASVSNKSVNYGYDDWGRRNSEQDPDFGTKLSKFNSFGELVRTEDNKGQVYTFDSYDALGRLTQKTGPEGIYKMEYDTKPNGKGLPTKFTGPNNNVIEFEYDSKSRLKLKTELIDGTPYIYSFQYNDFNQLTSKTYPSGFVADYHYDNYGNLTSISNQGRVIWECQEVDNFGNITKSTRGNGLTTHKSFTTDGFQESVVTNSRISNQHLQNWHFEFDHPTGLLNWRSNAGFVENFRYQNNQLVESKLTLSSTDVRVQSVSFENTKVVGKSDAADFLKYDDPQKSDPPNSIFELEGNIKIPQIPQTLEFTAFNKVSKIEEFPLNSPNIKLEFKYGFGQNRIQSEFSAPGYFRKKTYVGEFERERIGNGVRDITYISGPDGIIGFEESKNNLEKRFFYVYKDHMGSLSVITDDVGEIVEEHNFDAWGRRRDPITLHYLEEKEGTSNGYNFLLDRGFTFHEHHDQFGVINMNGRLYDPRLGRMLSPDPIIKDGSLASNYDRFAYAFNNPLMYTDPSGYIARLNDPSPQSAFTSTDLWSLPTVGFTVDGVPVAPQIAKGFLGRGGGGAAKVEYHSTHILGDHSVNHYDAVTYAEDNNLSYMPYLGYGKVADGLYKGRGEGFSIWENSLTGTMHVFDENTAAAAIFTSAEELMEVEAQNGGVMQAGIGGDLFNYGGAYMNIAGSLAGIAELSAQGARRFNNGGGPQSLAKAMTYLKGSYVGTQEVAQNLRSFGAGAKTLGTKLGIAGGLLATADYAYNFNDKNGYEHANYWIGAVVTIGAFANPIGAGAALIYGIGQGASWLYNGKSLEENVGRGMGW